MMPSEMSRRREAALVVTLAVVTTIALTYPLAFRLGTGGRVDTFDGRLSVWNVAWVARTVVADPAQLFHGNIFYPHRNALAFSEANLVAGVLAAPVYWLTGNPYTAYNTVVLLAFMLALVGAYLLVRRLTGSRPAAAVSGVLFAFCPYVFAHTTHMQLLMTGVLPFAMLTFHRFAERPSVQRGGVLGLMLAIAGLASGYYGLFAGLMVSVAIVFYAVTNRLWTNRTYWIGIAVAVVTGGVVVGVCFVPYLSVGETLGYNRPLDAAVRYSAGWRDYLVSPALAHGWLSDRVGAGAYWLFPGFLTLGLAGVGLVAVGWPGRADTGRPAGSGHPAGRHRRTVLLYTLIGVLSFWASFGPSGGLYTVLFNVTPGFGMLRAPARFAVVVMLALAVIAGVGVTRLVRRRAGVVATGIILLAMVELSIGPYPHVEAPPPHAAYRMLAGLPVGPVAEFPFFEERRDFPRHTQYMVGSMQHWQPLVNGYSDVIPQDFRDMSGELSVFPTRRGFDLLRRHQTRYILLHRHFYEQDDWAAIEGRFSRFAVFLKPLLWDNDDWLFEIVDWP